MSNGQTMISESDLERAGREVREATVAWREAGARVAELGQQYRDAQRTERELLARLDTASKKLLMEASGEQT